MATQNAARAHKAEVVEEVSTRMGAASGSIVSEYRGLSVAELADLRTALAGAGGDYRIFKNTLVRRAIDGSEYQPLSEYLSGPTALTFVHGDVSAVAKALRDFAKANPLLVIKGGLADGSLLSASDIEALADLPPREVLLARLAGAMAAPLQQMAGLLQALPRNLAYGIAALRDAAGRGRTSARRGARAGHGCGPGRARGCHRAPGCHPCDPGENPRPQHPRPPNRAADRRPRRAHYRAPTPEANRPDPRITDQGKKGRPPRWQP